MTVFVKLLLAIVNQILSGAAVSIQLEEHICMIIKGT